MIRSNFRNYHSAALIFPHHNLCSIGNGNFLHHSSAVTFLPRSLLLPPTDDVAVVAADIGDLCSIPYVAFMLLRGHHLLSHRHRLSSPETINIFHCDFSLSSRREIGTHFSSVSKFRRPSSKEIGLKNAPSLSGLGSMIFQFSYLFLRLRTVRWLVRPIFTLHWRRTHTLALRPPISIKCNQPITQLLCPHRHPMDSAGIHFAI